jgi:putative ABC transport system permease protein
MNLLSLAGKNLKRRKGRTILTIAGVAIAVAVLFSLLSISAGYERQLTQEMDSLGFHLLAVPKGCPYEAASLIIHGGVFPKYLSSEDLARVKATEGIAFASPLLLHQVVKNGTPHIIYGIEPNDITGLKPSWKVSGRYFEPGEAGVMVVGTTLAEKEGLDVGSVLPFGPDQEPFIIVGVLESTGSEDDNFHFIPLSEAQRLFGKEDRITAIAVRVHDVNQIAEISRDLETIPDVQVVTMAQVTGTIMNLVGSARTLLYTVIIIAILISGAGIVNSLLMSVNERTREFGMLKAIGASGLDIGILVLSETLIISTLGGILGIVVAVAGSGFIEEYVRDAIPYAPAGSLFSFEPVLVLIALVFSIILGLICGLYPAIRSGRLSPMETIREGFE